jgi:hypothetical protein
MWSHRGFGGGSLVRPFDTAAGFGHIIGGVINQFTKEEPIVCTARCISSADGRRSGVQGARAVQGVAQTASVSRRRLRVCYIPLQTDSRHIHEKCMVRPAVEPVGHRDLYRYEDGASDRPGRMAGMAPWSDAFFRHRILHGVSLERPGLTILNAIRIRTFFPRRRQKTIAFLCFCLALITGSPSLQCTTSN